MLQYAHQHGVSAPAQAFATTRKTGHKWLARYQARDTTGLHDHSKAAHCRPRKSSAPLSSGCWSCADSCHPPSRGYVPLLLKIQVPFRG